MAKNDFKIGSNEHPVTEDLSTVTVGGERSSLEISSKGNGARVSGDLEVTGDIVGLVNATDVLADDIVCDDLTARGSAVTIQQLDFTYESGADQQRIKSPTGSDLILDFSAGGNVRVKIGSELSFKILDHDGTTIAEVGDDWDDTSSHFLKINEDNISNYCKIGVYANGATTMSTEDSDGTVGHLTFDADGDIILDAATGITKFRLAGDVDDQCTLTVAANGATTIATEDSDGSAGHLELAVDGDTTLDAAGDIYLDPGSNEVYIQSAGTSTIEFNNGASNTAHMKMMSILDTGDYSKISTTTHGATTIATVDDNATAANLTLDADGAILLDSATGTFRLYDAGDLDDYLSITVESGTGATTIRTISEHTDGHLDIRADGHIEFDNTGVGFDKQATTFADAAVTSEGDDSTDIDFRLGNKHELILEDNIGGSGENINMIFPATSGNFILTVCQDATGSRTVEADGWKAYASDATLADNKLASNGTDGDVRWAGGSAPTLSTTARAVDLIAIYWDAGNQTALAVASLGFATP